MNAPKPEAQGRNYPMSARTGDYFPLLFKNSKQSPEMDVLSWDGKTVYPSVPTGGHIVRYSEKEQWHYENCNSWDGYETRWYALCDIWKALKDSEDDLKSLRRKAACNPICDNLDGHPPLPPPFGKKIRHAHIVLQLFFKYQFDIGVEVGAPDFWCGHCGKRFFLLAALDYHRKVSDSSEKALWLGFEAIEHFIISEDEFVLCPLCGKQTYPYFEFCGSTVEAPPLSEQDVLSILSESFGNGIKKLATPGRQVLGLFGGARLVTTDRNSTFFQTVLLIAKNQQSGKYADQKLPFEVSTTISGARAVISIRAFAWANSILGFEDQRDFNCGVNEVFEKRGIKGFWVEEELD